MSESKFEIIPAIDILDSKCVRLTQGDYKKVEEYSTNPAEVAKKWEALGAKRLHVVDLDGAKEGYPVNKKVILDLVKNTKSKVQLGGGIRAIETIKEYLACGISYVILGTKAYEDDDFLKTACNLYKDKVILGLDIKNNQIGLSGWNSTHDMNIKELKKKFKQMGEIIYTDILKDGTNSGPNIEQLEIVAQTFKANIIASGGIASIEDIVSIYNLRLNKCPNISGVILGKALYTGMVDLKSAIEIIDKNMKSERS